MAYTRRHWVDYPDTTTPIDADALNNIEDGIEESHNIQLLAVTDTAPSECAEGDKYYDTTTKLIYTATDTDEWGETGETPIYDILYIVLDEQTSYTYNGTTLVSVGGGSSTGGGETLPVGSEIDYDGTTVPTGWEETSAIQSKVKQLIIQGDYSSGTITLNDDIRNYDYLIIQTGTVSNNTYSAQFCFPFGPRLLKGWTTSDTLNGKTINGNFKLNINSFTELSIVSVDEHIRCIFGGKF